jgi:hypothetical protein
MIRFALYSATIRFQLGIANRYQLPSSRTPSLFIHQECLVTAIDPAAAKPVSRTEQ